MAKVRVLKSSVGRIVNGKFVTGAAKPKRKKRTKKRNAPKRKKRVSKKRTVKRKSAKRKKSTTKRKRR